MMTNRRFLARSRPCQAPALAGAALVMALGAPLLVAQRVPMHDADGRWMQVLDLRTLEHDKLGRMVQPAGSSADSAHAEKAAALLRHFVQPALRPGDDLRALGQHWIVVLADEDRITGTERLFQAARERRNELLKVEIRLLEVPKKEFVAELQESLTRVERDGATSFEAVIANDAALAFLGAARAAASGDLAAPSVSVLPLSRAAVAMVHEVAYVKDFEVTVGEGVRVASPVVDKVWEGNRSEVTATFLPGGLIGLRCEVEVQELHRPFPEVQTKLQADGAPVTIQVPRTSRVRLASTAQVAPGSLVVLAAQRSRGDYLVAVVMASAVVPPK